MKGTVKKLRARSNDPRMKRAGKIWVVLGAAMTFGCGDEGSDPNAGASASGGAGSPTGGSSGMSGNSAGGATGATDASSSMAGGAGTGGTATVTDSGREGGTLGKSPFDWVGVVGTGQSLSTGCCDGIPLSTTQPFKNLKLVDNGPDPKYPIDGAATAMLATSPLTEPIRAWVPGHGTCTYPPDNCQYPNNIFKNGETPHSAMANTLSA